MRYLAAMLVVVLGSTALAGAETYIVTPDGSGDFPTIQAAIDFASDGDIIELTNGTFTGDGNRDIDFLGKAVTVRSQSGNPETCIIDCECACRGVSFVSGEGPGARLEAATIINGQVALVGAESRGGALLCSSGSSPTVVCCRFISNEASGYAGGAGGGVYCASGCSPTFVGCTFEQNTAIGGGMGGGGGGAALCRDCIVTFEDCVFRENVAGFGGGVVCHLYATVELTGCVFEGNTAGAAGALDCGDAYVTANDCTFLANVATTYGGAVRCIGLAPSFDGCTFIGNSADGGGALGGYDSSPVLTGCTLAGNSAPNGAGIYLEEQSAATVEHTVIAFGTSGEAILCDGSATALLTCCDVFGNAGGDWTGCIADQLGVNGNICEHPLFCGPEVGDFTLAENSPCAPFTPPNPECDLIGAWPVGCGPASVPDEADPPGTAVTWGHLKSIFQPRRR